MYFGICAKEVIERDRKVGTTYNNVEAVAYRTKEREVRRPTKY